MVCLSNTTFSADHVSSNIPGQYWQGEQPVAYCVENWTLPRVHSAVEHRADDKVRTERKIPEVWEQSLQNIDDYYAIGRLMTIIDKLVALRMLMHLERL